MPDLLLLLNSQSPAAIPSHSLPQKFQKSNSNSSSMAVEAPISRLGLKKNGHCYNFSPNNGFINCGLSFIMSLKLFSSHESDSPSLSVFEKRIGFSRPRYLSSSSRLDDSGFSDLTSPSGDESSFCDVFSPPSKIVRQEKINQQRTASQPLPTLRNLLTSPVSEFQDIKAFFGKIEIV